MQLKLMKEMSLKKMAGIVALVVLGGLGGFVFLIYATVKTKSRNISSYKPFVEWVGTSVELSKETIVFKDRIGLNGNDDYPYILLDSLHPQWQYIDQRKSLPDPDLVEIARFPSGTIVKFEKAVQYTNGVSGSSYPTLFGKISKNDAVYAIGYQWGEIDMTKYFDKIDECWKFHQAPWQDSRDTAFYSLPTANIW
jgi:hypothetical protein